MAMAEAYPAYHHELGTSPIKTREALLFFALQGFGKTKLNKAMFHADFEAYAELGSSITGERYYHEKYGPSTFALYAAAMAQARWTSRICDAVGSERPFAEN